MECSELARVAKCQGGNRLALTAPSPPTQRLIASTEPMALATGPVCAISRKRPDASEFGSRLYCSTKEKSGMMIS